LTSDPIESKLGLENLQSHLSSSDFFGIEKSLKAIKEKGAQYLILCYELLKDMQADEDLFKVFKRTSEKRMGKTKAEKEAHARYFGETIRRDVVSIAWGDSPPKKGESSSEEGRNKLLVAYVEGEKSQKFKSLSEICKNLKVLEAEVRIELEKFVTTVPLPGDCDRCRSAVCPKSNVH
jgi:hypothetical protein